VSDFEWTKALTIPNFLKFYNPLLQGQSYGETTPFTKGSNLNGAVVQSKIEDIPPQIDYLVQTLKSSEYSGVVDFNHDWKLLTLFIGANNLCVCCHNDSRGTPEYFETHLRSILSQIQATIPRTFVNIITIFNISGVWNAGQEYEYCKILWQGITTSECPCLLKFGAEERQEMDHNGYLFNQVSEKVATEFSSQNTKNPNFTVVVQPGITGFNITYFGSNFLSELDCFHPALDANEAFTLAIWNNMLTPPPLKKTSLDPADFHIICPTVDSVLQ